MKEMYLTARLFMYNHSLCFFQAFDITVYDKKDDKPEEKAAAIVKKPAATEPAAKAPPVEIKV